METGFPCLRSGLGSALGFAVGIAVTILVACLGSAAHPVLGLVLIAAGVAAVSLMTTMLGAVCAAVQSWGLYAGFILGKWGIIVWTPESLRSGVLLLGVAVVASAAMGLSRRIASQRSTADRSIREVTVMPALVRRA